MYTASRRGIRFFDNSEMARDFHLAVGELYVEFSSWPDDDSYRKAIDSLKTPDDYKCRLCRENCCEEDMDCIGEDLDYTGEDNVLWSVTHD
jgi:hypothetical protein